MSHRRVHFAADRDRDPQTTRIRNACKTYSSGYSVSVGSLNWRNMDTFSSLWSVLYPRGTVSFRRHGTRGTMTNAVPGSRSSRYGCSSGKGISQQQFPMRVCFFETKQSKQFWVRTHPPPSHQSCNRQLNCECPSEFHQSPPRRGDSVAVFASRWRLHPEVCGKATHHPGN